MHYNTVSPELKFIIDTISKDKNFEKFNLCGGTSLSLQIGHRISVDADFICETDFDKAQLVADVLQIFPNARDIHQGSFGLFCIVNEIKVDFLSWKIPFIRDVKEVDGIRFISLEDIIAMKLFAILQRGEKKDYMDIISLLNKYSLKEMIEFYQERHNNGDASLVLRFLASYSDIDKQPEPIMLNGLTWENAKTILNEEIKKSVF